MKRIRLCSGRGNGTATIPGGQILCITMVPGPEVERDPPTGTGGWIRIATNAPIWVPYGYPIDLQAADLGNCCGEYVCDRWPGEVQIEIVFGQNAAPSNEDAGDEPAAWCVIYNGC